MRFSCPIPCFAAVFCLLFVSTAACVQRKPTKKTPPPPPPTVEETPSSRPLLPVATSAAIIKSQLMGFTNTTGDIIIEDGTYDLGEFGVVLENKTTTTRNIRARNTGKVTLRGGVFFRIKGDNVHIKGMNFLRSAFYMPKSSIITFDNSRFCSTTQCTFEETQNLPVPEDIYPQYIIFYQGAKNKVHHCVFKNKRTHGFSITMTTPAPDLINGNHHVISQNFFVGRPLGTNQADGVMRLGVSGKDNAETSNIPLYFEVIDNTFDHCDGYVEIISNKSSNNSYINNTFKNCNGYICIRNGNRCIIKNNRFLGTGQTTNYGVRIQGRGHIIENNYFENLYKAIFLMGGDGNIVQQNAKIIIPHYINTDSVAICNNSILNCKIPIFVYATTAAGNLTPPNNIFMERNAISTTSDADNFIVIPEILQKTAKIEQRFTLKQNVLQGNGALMNMTTKSTTIENSNTLLRRANTAGKQAAAAEDIKTIDGLKTAETRQKIKIGYQAN